MDKDQEAQHHRENQGSLVTTVKVEGSEAVNNNEHRSWVCHICKKGFGSGKALGGHMRIHNLSKKQQVHRAKQGTTSVAKPKTNKWVFVSGNPTCSLCGKSFSSMKSLFGHLRSHPERMRMGIQNNTPSINGASSNSTSSSTISDDSAAIDLSQALRGCWSVSAKRGRRSASCSKSNSGLEDDGEIEPHMQEAVYNLMLLASGNPKWEEELDGDHIEEKKLLSPVFGDSDEMKRDRMRVTKKMKLTELEAAEDGDKLCRICNTTFPSHQALEGHLCSSINFKNIQVMDESESDGVLATKEEHHAKTTTMQEHHAKTTTMQGEETGTDLGGNAVEAIRGCQCKIFIKTFSTGQVFGDHKRSNWTSMAEAQSSAQATSSPVKNAQNCSKILTFDLNQLPAMDGQDGVQSDLLIPSNIMTSFNYGSSS